MKRFKVYLLTYVRFVLGEPCFFIEYVPGLFEPSFEIDFSLN